jgi:hypothetical protein
MYLSKLYPWQLITRAFNVDMACRLPLDFDTHTLQDEVSAIMTRYSPKAQFGPYHDGGWAAIGLMAGKGDYRDDRPSSDIRKTEPLGIAPYMNSIIESFEVPTERVRLMQLEVGERIHWHYDGDFLFPDEKVRLHIPIFTNDDVQFQIGHQDQVWRPGELWFGDFSFPHRLHNAGTGPRIHLVLDLKFQGKVRSLFPSTLFERTQARKWAQLLCRRAYTLCTPKLLAERVTVRASQLFAHLQARRS